MVLTFGEPLSSGASAPGFCTHIQMPRNSGELVLELTDRNSTYSTRMVLFYVASDFSSMATKKHTLVEGTVETRKITHTSQALEERAFARRNLFLPVSPVLSI